VALDFADRHKIFLSDRHGLALIIYDGSSRNR
jgi:hypothetical protein